MKNGGVIVKGPMTREEKVEWDELRQKKDMFEQELSECRQELIDNPRHEHRQFIEDDIIHTERVLDIIRRVIPD